MLGFSSTNGAKKGTAAKMFTALNIFIHKNQLKNPSK